MNSFDPAEEYLYRGTTLDWPGSHANQMLPMTCTSTDPLVATLFALECIFHGHAVVQFVVRSSVERFVGEPNFFDVEEKAVNLRLRPSELAKFVIHSIDADDARDILHSMGFDQVPYQIYGVDVRSDELELTARIGHRLTLDQLQEFNRLASKVAS